MVERLFKLTKGESALLDDLATSQHTTPEFIILQALAKEYPQFGEGCQDCDKRTFCAITRKRRPMQGRRRCNCIAYKEKNSIKEGEQI